MKKYLIILLILIAGSLAILVRSFPAPLSPLTATVVDGYAVQDIGSVLGGLRRLGADIAWVQLLLYYGTPETPVDKETEFKLSWDMTKYLLGRPVSDDSRHDQESSHESTAAVQKQYEPQLAGGKYPDLLKYCERVVALDPFFEYAYLYGAGALAWNLNRPEEGLRLLRQGIKTMERYRSDLTKDVHQPYWQFHLYMSAIIYRNAGETGKMVSLLETAARQPGAPNMVKAILANIYQKDGRTADSLKLWMEIYDSGDPSYRARAEEKIQSLGRELTR